MANTSIAIPIRNHESDVSPQTLINPNIIVVPGFSLETHIDSRSIDAPETPLTQSTTDPADRTNQTYQTLPAIASPKLEAIRTRSQAMTLTERVELLRGPVEDGID